MNFTYPKKLFLILILVLIKNVLYPQGFERKDVCASGSIGLTHVIKKANEQKTKTADFKNSFKGNVDVKVRGANPISLRYEYALSPYFGLGLSIAWWSVLIDVDDRYSVGTGSSAKNYTDSYNYRLSSISVGLRPNYHIPSKNKKLDIFVGCAFGLAKNDMTVNFSSTQSNGLFAGSYNDFHLANSLYFAPTFGIRYFFVNNLGLNFELGYEKGALLLAGLVYRFRPFHYERPK